MLYNIRVFAFLTPFLMLPMFAVSSAAQEAKPAVDKPVALQIRITEYTINGPIDNQLTNKELLDKVLASVKAGNNRGPNEQPFAVVKNVLRFTHVVGYESTVQTGRRFSVVVGESRDPRGGVMRNSTMLEIGTQAKLKVIPQESGAYQAHITYDSSDVEASTPDAINPDITQNTLESTVILEPGKPALLIGAEGRSPKALTITID